MLCKWCGMESVTTDQCSWCHRNLSAAPAETLEATDAPVSAEQAAEPAPVPESEAESPQAIEGEEPAAEAEVSPVAPWTIAPAPPVPPSTAPSTSDNSASEAARPIIGVRRPAPGMGRPAPAMPPPMTARKSGTTGAASGATGSPSHAPAPAIPPARRAAPSTPGAPARSQSSAVGDKAGTQRPAAAGENGPAPSLTGGAAPAVRPVPLSRPAVPAALTGPRPASSVANPSGGKPAAAPLLTDEALTLPEMDAGNVPALGTFTPAKSKYYVGQVVDPVSGTHYDADTGHATSGPMGHKAHLGDGNAPSALQTDEIEAFPEARSPLIGLGWYAVALGVILFFAGLFAFVSTAHYVLPLLAAQFFGALLMPVMRVVPWADEDADDAVLFVLLTLVCGPVVGLIIYGVISLLRQDTNPAILGCFIVAALARIVVEIAVGVTGEGAGFAITQLAPFAQVQHFDIRLLLINWSGLAALAGWYTASIFHKLDE